MLAAFLGRLVLMNFVKVVISFVLLNACFFSFAQQNIEQIRADFVEAERLAKYGPAREYYAYASKIKDYPLAPYAEATFLKNHLSLNKKKQIQALLTRYPNAPFSHSLRKAWLNYLAKRQLRQAFTEQYVDVGDVRLRCINLTWQLQGGASKQEILNQVEDIWLAPFSQPKECNYIFDVWKEAGYLTSEQALKRLILAAKEKNYRLLPYLKGMLELEDKHLASMWKMAVKRPANIAKSRFFLSFNEREKDVFLYAVNKLVFSAPEKVETLWQELSPKFPLSAAEKTQVTKKLALSFAIANHEESLEWLLKVPEEVVDESIKQWRLAYSLENGDWQDTYNIVSSLPEQMQTDEAVVYWKARALEQLGDAQWANNTFSELSERRDYYGFLAANKMQKQVSLRHVPLQISEFEFLKVGRNEVLQRAYEFFKLERYVAARKEWNLLTQQLTDREKLAAAQLAHNWGWYDRPIFTLAQVGYLNDVNLRFPLAYRELISQQARQNKVDPAFVFAIARRESSFMHDAYSSAGAAGLMQIKPSTASYVAKSKVKKRQLFKPEKNAKLATSYLSYLMKKSKGNPIVATAAYNAGFSRVKRWLPEQSMPADAWIETIPYKETRNYVKAVMAYTEVYQELLNKDSNVFNGMQNSQIEPTL